MGEFSDTIIHFSRQLAVRAAAEQGGVLSGDNPANYLASDPFRLWVIQLILILAMTQFLAFFFDRIRQPRVIAEVIGGVFLGPSVLGRIPNFRARLFPTTSIAGLSLTSTIGLVLFLFLVGLEIDTKIIKRNLVSATCVSAVGLIVPLGLGAALGIPIYKEFINPQVNYGYFLLFTAVAIGITAFPVLCRILTSLKLLDTTVGTVTLAAGVGNDVVGWILLALTVALVNAASGLTALYVLLVCVGYVLFLIFPGRWAYRWLARWTGSLEQGAPTAGMMTLTLVIVFVSAFFTDIIGVHAIFGGFLAGLIIPHDNGYAIAIVERLEDFVSIILIPIYFALSGLSTNLGALNTGKAWGYTILICVVALFSKFIPCFTAAYATGFNWREAGAIGSLMSCKGLVELIVLNIGLSAGILDTRSFSMFVVHAIIVTFLTTPLTLFFYPERVRVHAGREHGHRVESGAGLRRASDDEFKTRFALVLDKIEQLPAAMTMAQLLQSNNALGSTTTLTSTGETPTEKPESFAAPPVSINALRLIELTNRTSAVFKSQAVESLVYNDPVVSIFRTFGYLNHFHVSGALSVVGYDEFPSSVSRHVTETDSQVVLIPWSRGVTVVEDEAGGNSSAFNPFDGVFHKTTTYDQTSSVVYSEFIRNVFSTSPAHVALFVDRGISAPNAGSAGQHLFMPFFGGPDDRLALSFLVQLCRNVSVHATVVRITILDGLSRQSTAELNEKRNSASTSSPPETPGVVFPALTYQTIAAADTVYAQGNTETRLASTTADDVLWDRYTTANAARDAETTGALTRITFKAVSSAQPLNTIADLVGSQAIQVAPMRNVIVVTGRSRKMAVQSHKVELQQIITSTGATISSSVPKTLGEVGAALVAKNSPASLLVLQAANGTG